MTAEVIQHSFGGGAEIDFRLRYIAASRRSLSSWGLSAEFLSSLYSVLSFLPFRFFLMIPDLVEGSLMVLQAVFIFKDWILIFFLINDQCAINDHVDEELHHLCPLST